MSISLAGVTPPSSPLSLSLLSVSARLDVLLAGVISSDSWLSYNIIVFISMKLYLHHAGYFYVLHYFFYLSN